MGGIAEITGFMDRARGDPRIGPLHVSLYLAIVYCWVQQGSQGPALVSGRELRPLAKITGGTPFYRVIRQLNAYGYIVYEPSFNPAVKSKVFLSVSVSVSVGG